MPAFRGPLGRIVAHLADKRSQSPPTFLRGNIYSRLNIGERYDARPWVAIGVWLAPHRHAPVGNVDFATRPSGFMVIEDNGATDPLFWAVDHHGLSGLWNFPTGGFDRIPTCYNETFTSANLWSATHNLNTRNVIVQVYDDSGSRIQLIPDQILVTSANNVDVRFNIAQVGHVVIVACENS